MAPLLHRATITNHIHTAHVNDVVIEANNNKYNDRQTEKRNKLQ